VESKGTPSSIWQSDNYPVSLLGSVSQDPSLVPSLLRVVL
jgi:hypothetical protein